MGFTWDFAFFRRRISAVLIVGASRINQYWWSNIPNTAIVSYTSNLPETDTVDCFSRYITRVRPQQELGALQHLGPSARGSFTWILNISRLVACWALFKGSEPFFYVLWGPGNVSRWRGRQLLRNL